MRLDEMLGKTPARRFLAVCVGSVLYGLALGLFFVPNGIAPGGVSGVAVMLGTVIPIGVGSLTMFINLPLLIISILKWGWRFLFSTVAAIVISGVTADICVFFPPVTENMLLASLAGGAMLGLGCAIVFRAGSTTGGTDIVTRLLKLRYPYLKMSTLLLMLDGAIALASGFVFRNADNALYSILAITVFSKVLDGVMYGADSARMVFVISNKSDEILRCLIRRVNVGCTVLKGVSGYEGKDKRILLCAMRKPLLPVVKKAVLDIDDRAFMLVTNAGEIFGEGFKTDKSGFY
ncbi:MAG: YitT family protein [Oscillospiraceae bacterium]